MAYFGKIEKNKTDFCDEYPYMVLVFEADTSCEVLDSDDDGILCVEITQGTLKDALDYFIYRDDIEGVYVDRKIEGAQPISKGSRFMYIPTKTRSELKNALLKGLK